MFSVFTCSSFGVHSLSVPIATTTNKHRLRFCFQKSLDIKQLLGEGDFEGITDHFMVCVGGGGWFLG